MPVEYRFKRPALQFEKVDVERSLVRGPVSVLLGPQRTTTTLKVGKFVSVVVADQHG